MVKTKKSIVVIGGGTGTYTVLSGLKKYKNIDISVVVSMMDSGGSNRIIRDEFGLLPTSDLRQCMVALSSEKPSELVRNLFSYRYINGTGISGMTFGNLFMAALTDIYRSQEIAIEKTCEFLDVRGAILPVTYEKTNLVARYDNGKQILGEHYIDEPEKSLKGNKIVELSVFPPAQANPKAIKAIKEADLIVLGPGDLYTSILCNLVVDGVAKAVANSKARRLFVMNLMTRSGQTDGYTAYSHLVELEKYIGKKIDFCLINKSSYDNAVLKRYEEENTFPVVDDLKSDQKMKVIKKDLLGKKVFTKNVSDKLTRSLIRHDSLKLAKAIISLL